MMEAPGAGARAAPGTPAAGGATGAAAAATGATAAASFRWTTTTSISPGEASVGAPVAAAPPAAAASRSSRAKSPGGTK